MDTLMQIINENWRWLGPVMVVAGALTLTAMIIDLAVGMFEE